MKGVEGDEVVIYGRFSSDKQSERSIDGQVALCREWLARQSIDATNAQVFADYAVSAASLQRPGMDALLARAREGAIKVIVVETIDRLSRDQADTFTVLREWSYLGVRVIGVDDGIDTDREGANLLIGVRAALSQEYLRDLKKKTLRGLRDRARAGMATGGLPYGFRSRPVEGGHAIEVDAAQAEIVRRIFELYASGLSLADVAAVLNRDGIAPPRASRARLRNTWQVSTVRTVLQNEKYVGRWSYGEREWRKAPGSNTRRPRARDDRDVIRTERPELAFISPATWASVRARFDSTRLVYTGKRTVPVGKRQVYLLSGLLKCGLCGSQMSIYGGDAERRYYRCAGAGTRGTCAFRNSVRESLIREHVSAHLRDRIGRGDLQSLVTALLADVASIGDSTELERRRVSADLEKCRAASTKLAGLIAESDDDVTHVLMTRLREEQTRRAGLEARIRELALQPVVQIELPTAAELIESINEALGDGFDGDVKTGREALRGLLDGGSILVSPAEGKPGWHVSGGLRPVALLPPSVSRIAGASTSRDLRPIPFAFDIAS